MSTDDLSPLDDLEALDELAPLLDDLTPLPAPTPPPAAAPAVARPAAAAPRAPAAPGSYRSRHDVLQLLDTCGWKCKATLAYEKDAHKVYVFLDSASFICACCYATHLSFTDAYNEIVRRS